MLCQGEQRFQPVAIALSPARQEMVGSLARGDLQVPVASPASGELDESVAVGVQHAELQGTVADRRQLAAERASVGEAHPAAQAAR